MTDGAPDIDAVTALVQSISRAVILPRFRNLRSDQIERKVSTTSHEDLVTVADREAERCLVDALLAMTPGAAVIGEEGTYADPQLLDRLANDGAIWVIDPIDGTRNFCAGDDRFGVMVSWVVDGITRAAWVHLPARELTFVAERGGGTFCNGARLTIPAATPAVPRGRVHTGYMPAPLGAAVTEAMAGQYTPQPDAWCAAIEYTDVVTAERDFAVYYRLLPWDHAAPALIVTEAGGCVEHLDGSAYTLRSAHQVTVVARDAAIALQIRTAIASRV
jgi:fructose-1,6-bisphosphatase/inositol monophosphatase family enzyme